MVSRSSCPVRERIATVYKLKKKISKIQSNMPYQIVLLIPSRSFPLCVIPNNRTREKVFAPK